MIYTVATTTTSLASVEWGTILGGFGMFLFGCTFMGNGLKNFAGDKLREYIEKYTKSPWQGILIGALVTAFLHSSAATTAITIGLIRAGLMKLNQAVGIIMGANIGTTITAFLIGFDFGFISLYCLFLGTLLYVFSSRKKFKYFGEFLIGFGLLFFGLSTMSDALSPLYELPEFISIIEVLTDKPLLSLIVSIIATAVMQSSTALIAIIQKMYDAGSITLAIALPFLFGSNIGTTITAIFAALGGSLAAKRAAAVHVLFNLSGSILFMILLNPFTSIIMQISGYFDASPSMQVALAHILFNITVTVLFYPFIDKLVALIKKVIRGEERQTSDNIDELLNADIAKRLPSSALSIAHTATVKMGELCVENIGEVINYFDTKNSSSLEAITSIESLVDNYDKKIQNYLILIAQEHLNNDDAHHYMSTMQIIKNMERISDLCCNLGEFFEMTNEAKEEFSPDAVNELHNMLTTVKQMMEISIECYETNSVDLYHKNKDLENQVDEMEESARANHIKRMSQGLCMGNITTSIFVDVVGTIERMGDHASNISRYTISHERALGNKNVPGPSSQTPQTN